MAAFSSEPRFSHHWILGNPLLEKSFCFGHTFGMSTSQLPVLLKRCRTEQELTLDALSERSGVSRGMISKIERGQASPSAEVLGKLAEALGQSISQLVGGVRGDGIVKIEALAQPVYKEEPSGFERRSLSPMYRGRGVDFVLNTLPAGARTSPFPSHRAGVEEHLFVEQGQLRVHIGDKAQTLSAGDFLFYPADVEHTFENIGAETARFFIVIDSTRLR